MQFIESIEIAIIINFNKLILITLSMNEIFFQRKLTVSKT